MRLWTLHPRYLDSRGLVSLWREALLAQAALAGKAGSFGSHPQLARFRQARSAKDAIRSYLLAIHAESLRRGFRFTLERIDGSGEQGARDAGVLVVTRGQLDYEWEQLRDRLRKRSPAALLKTSEPFCPDPHPLFQVVRGPVAAWEVRESIPPRVGTRP